MSASPFLAALDDVTAGRSGLTDLVEAVEGLKRGGDTLAAEQLYKVWIALNPADPQLFVALFNCAILQSDRGDLAGARDGLLRCIELQPSFPPAYINLGGVLERSGAVNEAVSQWSQLVEQLAPIAGPAVEHKLTALKQIGRVLIDHQRHAQAEATLRQALEIRPQQPDVLEQFTALRLAQCEWPVIVAWDNVDRRTLMSGLSPLSAAIYTDDPLLQLGAAKRYTETTVGDFAPVARKRDPPPISEAGDRRIRVGYVSSDLRDHAIGYLMAEVFELHDGRRFEIFVYHCGPHGSGEHNARIRKGVEHWTDLHAMSDDEAAAQIAADGIDVLVDVNGLTREARTGVFARRPAPVQVNWLGYPGSMASPYHHYIIADEWIIPPEFERYYSEEVLRLPCYQPNDRKRIVAPGRPTRGEAGLPQNGFVFCCFNGVQKITRFHFERWLQILRRTPDAVLWLLESSPEISARLGDYAEAGGVARDRLVFAPKQANAAHLARYPLADLFLDTSPYGAHTTASDALWMGVPVLTLSGRGFAARVCGSLVRAAGLGELVCADGQVYVEAAVALASDPTRVEQLKARLERGRGGAVLFDMEALVASLEALYGRISSAPPPQPGLGNLELYFELGVQDDHDQEERGALADYDGHYRRKLALRHAMRPFPADGRLRTAADAEASCAG